ncbi:MAG: hypothetical protein GY679_01195 [Mycoplasma sp.]|nr:hypothetical protein [Mycoplasma sp.]
MIFTSKGTQQFRRELNRELIKENLGFLKLSKDKNEKMIQIYIANDEKKSSVLKLIESVWNYQLTKRNKPEQRSPINAIETTL